ncbi:MAG: tetratricopeptide repeat protein [Candidatus Tectomicrobia bacterium]|nr:tetratricopeptide repeat protein [Candidatus Tectomicrobia bacterium]
MWSYTARLLGLSLLALALTIGAALARASDAPQTRTATPAERALQTAEAFIAQRPQQPGGYLALAKASIRKARESGDDGYYQRAERAIQHVLAQQPDASEALFLLAWTQTGQHQFAAALKTAERLHQRLPDNHQVYGLLGDAHVELGQYDQAASAWQRMIDLRPGPAAYSRIAYLRELYGDLQGATEMMAMAVRAASPRDPETYAWLLVQCGDLHFEQGRLKVAEAAYEKARHVFPSYYRVVAAMARLRAAQRRYPKAIELYQQAITIVPAPDMIAALGDLYHLTGQPATAEKQYAQVAFIARLDTLNQATHSRQTAHFYADHDRNIDAALAMMEREIKHRHDIYTYDTLAWVYYKAGRLSEAQKAMQKALRLGTQDASLWYHAGMIAHSLGELDTARAQLRRALDTNPYFSPLHARRARLTLAEIESTARLQSTHTSAPHTAGEGS